MKFSEYADIKLKSLLNLILLTQLLWITSAFANPTLDDFATNAEVMSQLQGPGITLSNFSVVTGSTKQFGMFTGGNSSTTPGPQIGIEKGLYMTTGRSSITIRGPNNSAKVSDEIGTVYRDPQLVSIDKQAIYDPSIIQMQAVTVGDYLKISFVFASEEYPEYVCSRFNDSFGMFIKKASLPDTPANWKNIAITPGASTPIAVNNINSGSCGVYANNYSPRILTNAEYFVSNGTGSTPGAHTNLQFDGLTIPFTVETPVTPGVTYDVKIAVADASDAILDSALFLKWLSGSEFNTNVDLELDLQVSNTALNTGDNVVFTLNIDNKGQDDAPEIQTSFPLPPGFTYVSNSAGGTYNPGTGILTTPAGLAAFTGSNISANYCHCWRKYRICYYFRRNISSSCA